MALEQTVTPNIHPALPPSTDPFGEVLQLLQLTGVLYCSAELTAPWGIEIPDLPGVMNVEVVTSGHCWIQLEGEPAVLMPEGSLVLIPRGRRHKLIANQHDKTTPLEDISVDRIGDRFESMQFGGGGRTTRMTYYGIRFDPFLAQRLIQLFPEMLHMHTCEEDQGWLNSTIRFIDQEARQRLPGCETMITRLADTLVIQVIRTWVATAQEEKSGWISALYDRQIGKALSLMHRLPHEDWRVSSLAAAAGMSRSGFSARFTSIVGESAGQYLTDLRMQLAHRELRRTSDPLSKIAERVGYRSEPAFNRAFKRVMGVPPGAIRKEK